MQGDAREVPCPSGRPECGFTLVELMVVVAMVAILAAAAVVFVKPQSHARMSRAYAHAISALADSMSERATATRKWQRLEVDDDGVIHWQSTTTGMTPPTEWEQVDVETAPNGVVVSSYDDSPHVTDGADVPAAGEGLPATIDFSPDGRATASTIFITDEQDEKRARVVIYPATGSAYVSNEW